MQNVDWQPAIEQCADPARAKNALARFEETPAKAWLDHAEPETARLLAALFSGSAALTDMLAAHPDWLTGEWLNAAALRHPRHASGLHREIAQWLEPCLQARDYAAAFGRLRQFKQREMLRIAVRDLGRLAGLEDIIREISNVADACLEAMHRLCWQPLKERLGTPYHQGPDGIWRPTGFCVMGLGKLGGQELNYSSDIDVIFVYAEEGSVFKKAPTKGEAGGRGLSNHQFFTRLAEAIISEVGRLTSDGALFRIDLRLRPEGNAGPLARSVDSYENYYAQWGQIWERMMLIKARRVAGDEELAAEFLEMIQTFRYPRMLGERIFREVAAMKQRIETEVVKAGEIERNVKLGRGGIREIEFTVQTLQLLHAGRLPFLQGAQTLPGLEKLSQYNLMAPAESNDLKLAYRFLRDVEHRLQMEANLQTHTIPTDKKARTRLAALMGAKTLAGFEAELRRQTGNVRRVYEKLLKIETPAPASDLPARFDGLEAEWTPLLAAHSFRDPAQALRVLTSLVHGPGYVHVSSHTVELAWQLLPRLLALCPQKAGDSRLKTEAGKDGNRKSGDRSPAGKPRRSQQAKPAAKTATAEAPTAGEAMTGSNSRIPPRVLSDPDRVVARLDSFVVAYGARSMLFEAWASNSSLFELLVLLFDRSEFLAETAIRTPDLVDGLEQSGQLRRTKNAVETLKDLRYGLQDEDQRQWVRRYHQTELMRIGLRDILGLSDFDDNLAELTALADACLQYALAVTLRKNKLSRAPFAIIGLGKLGGAELTYGSDLDLVFVADNLTADLPRVQRLAVEVMELLSAKTELGQVYETDARLRPDGAKGLLVNTIRAYEDYYRQRAMLWEIQTLTRARWVAGDESVGRRFGSLAQTLTDFSKPNLPLAALVPSWRAEIARMRQRIEKERTPAGQQALAFKTGAGGLMDVEFIAQTLCLAHGWQEPNTLRALRRAQNEQALPCSEAAILIENYGRLQRLEGILRRWSVAGESVLPTDPAAQYRVAVRCGFADASSFLKSVTAWRQEIRQVYAKFFR